MNGFIDMLKTKYLCLPVNVKASVWFLVSAFFQRGILVITTPVFTRIMTTVEYGEFNVFYSWYGIITILVTLNLFFGVYVRGLIKFEKENRIFSSSMEGLTLTLTLGWFAIYLLFPGLFYKILSLNAQKMICMFVIIWTNSAFSFWAAEQRVNLKYKKLVTLSIISVVVTPIIQILLMNFIFNKVMARIYGLAVINVLLYTPLFVKQMKNGKLFYSAKYWKYALSFNIPLLPHYLSQTILNSADRLMINDMIGTGEAGIYSLAYSISQIMTIFNSSLMQTMEPWLYKKIRDKKTNEISQIAYSAFCLIAVVNLILIVIAPEVIVIFAPKEYYSAIWIIPPVAMSVFFQFLYTFFAVFEFYYEKTKYITIATMVGAVVNVILNYIFIKIYGYYAAGYTTLICFILYAVFHYIFMNKLIKQNHSNEKAYNLKVLLFISIIFLFLGFSILFTYNYPIIRYSVIIILILVMSVKYKILIKLLSKFVNIRKERR